MAFTIPDSDRIDSVKSSFTAPDDEIIKPAISPSLQRDIDAGNQLIAAKKAGYEDNPSDVLSAVANSRYSGIDKNSPISVPLAPLTIAGNVARAAASDLMATATGHPSYGGNLNAISNEEPLPADINLSQISKSHPVVATIGKTAQGLAATAPAMVVFPEGALGKLAAAGFSADMIKGGGDAATSLGEELGKNPEDRDSDKITSSLSSLAQSAAFAPLAGKFASKTAILKLADQLKKEPKPITEAQNADTIKSSIPPNGDQASGTAKEVAGGKPGYVQQTPAAQSIQTPKAGVPETAKPVTEENIDSLPVGELSKVNHVDGMKYGIGLTDADVPRLEAKYKEASDQMAEAAKSQDDEKIRGAFGKYNFYGGSLQGATRGKHPAAAGNYDVFAKLNPDLVKNTETTPENPPVISESGPKVKQVSEAHQSGERVFYRGTEPGRTERIKSPFANGKLFVSPTIEGARMYGSSIETVTAKNTAKILVEGTPEFKKITGVKDVLRSLKKGERLPSGLQRAVDRAEKAGYDAVQFKSNSDVGTVILNESQFNRNAQSESSQPASIQKYRVGNNPTLHTVVEKLPASDVEIQNGEQPVKVKNEKTGEVSTVLESDLTAVKESVGPKGKKQSVPDKLKSLGYSDAEISAMDASGQRALAQRGMPKHTALGGATPNEPAYPAVSLLKDQLQAAQSVGKDSREKIAIGDQVADAWSKGKSKVEQTLAKTLVVKESLRDIARGVRDISDLDKRVAKLDLALQQSSGRSVAVGKAMKSQIKNRSIRDGAILWIDSGGDEALIKDAISKLPANTSLRVRNALKAASELPPEGKDLANSLQQYYGIRGSDALEEGVMEKLLADYATHIWKKESNMPQALKDAIANGRVSTYFQFGKKRTIGKLIDGILSGKEPELDPAEIVPYYNYQLDRAIASRQFIHDATESLAEKDGRPTFAPSGVRNEVEKGGAPESTFITPRAKGMVKVKGQPETPSEEVDRVAQMGDYRSIEHPAMRKWKWAATDENGKPIFYQSDLLVHPDAYERIARFMDRGRLTPTKIGKIALEASTQVKGAKLGLFSLFHPVHVGSHALFHWTNPFKSLRSGDIEWDAPKTVFAIEKGHLKLAPNPAELNNFADGVLNQKLLIHRIPFIGAWSRAQADWTFSHLIPNLKISTFENAYNRAIWMRDNMGSYKGLSEDQIASRIGDSVNNAFGELNHLFLNKYGRDPRFQRLLRGIFLAPDFGEARLRFIEKSFTKYGHEERMALATMFVTMYLGARAANLASNGDPQWDWKHAFSVKVGDHWWSMRSVVGDLDRMFADSGRFFYVRLNPLFSQRIADILIGRDTSGRKLSTVEKFVTRPMEMLIPIQLGALTRDDQKLWESFVTAMGVQTQRDNPISDAQKLASDFKKNSKDPKIRSEWERSQSETFAASDYAPMKYALMLDNPKKAFDEYQKLISDKGKNKHEIRSAMMKSAPISGSAALEPQFVSSLNANDLKTYQDAKAKQKELQGKFKDMESEFGIK